MNLNSEIQFFMDLRPVDKARLLNLFLHELAEEARATYGPAEQVHDGVHLRFVNELYHRLTRVIGQILVEEATRPADDMAPQFIKELVDYGAGPRAGQNLILGGKAMAAMDGRFSVSLDDIRKVAAPVLRHRISTNFQAQAEGQSTDTLIKRLVSEIREPETPKYERPGR